jgi:hypothetical protein
VLEFENSIFFGPSLEKQVAGCQHHKFENL